MDRASAFVVAVSAGALTYDRGFGRSIAGAVTAIAWEHSGHIPDDVPLHVLVGGFLSWQYDAGAADKLRPAWARERQPAYSGPIAVGMRFTWAAGDPKEECDLDVTRLDDDGGPRVWARHADRRVLPEWERLDPNTRLVRTRYGRPVAEKEFREMVTPCRT